MAIIYHERDGVRYSELSCAGCHRTFAVSQDVLDFYYDQAPAQPYLCPACRRQHDPRAAVHGQVHQSWPAAI